MARRLPHLAATLALLVVIGAAARAEDAPAVPPPAPSASPAPAPEPSWFTPPPGAACRQWSDGCHVCVRSSDDAAPSCSTPSIACVQAASRCLEPAQ